MSEKKPILLKNRSVNSNAVIYSLLALLFSIIIPLVIGKILYMEEDETVSMVPYFLILAIILIAFIFLKYRKTKYLLECRGDALMLKSTRSKQVVAESSIEDAKIEYGYYNYRHRTLINRQVPIISFRFSNFKPFRCSFTTIKPIILFWEGDDTQKEIYHVQTNLESPNYNIDPLSFVQLAKMLVPDHKLVQLELRYI